MIGNREFDFCQRSAIDVLCSLLPLGVCAWTGIWFVFAAPRNNRFLFDCTSSLALCLLESRGGSIRWHSPFSLCTSGILLSFWASWINCILADDLHFYLLKNGESNGAIDFPIFSSFDHGWKSEFVSKVSVLLSESLLRGEWRNYAKVTPEVAIPLSCSNMFSWCIACFEGRDGITLKWHRR